jgi:hypothetical protein
MAATPSSKGTLKTSTMTLGATPSRPTLVHRATSAASAGTPSSSAHRLLYRGGLALAHSLLILDGLTFVAAKDAGLLENPLALALESMRGRPTLRLLGACSLDELGQGKDGLWIDDAGDVRLYVLRPNFFFCLKDRTNACCIGTSIQTQH